MRRICVLVMMMVATQMGHSAMAQPSPFQNLMQKGLLMGMEGLGSDGECNIKQQTAYTMVCTPKSVLIPPLRELLRNEPENYDANYFLGYLLVDLNRAAEAIGPLKVAAAIHPEYQWSYTVLAAAYDQLGNHEAAIDLMEECLHRPREHYASNEQKSLIEFRYFDTNFWADEVARQYRYYVMSGHGDKAKELLSAYPPNYSSLIKKDMRDDEYSALDMHEVEVGIDVDNALDALKKGNIQDAHDFLLRALRFEAEQDVSDLLYGVASTSFDLGLYGDALWAYHGAENLGLDLNIASLVKMGVSYLVLGDYQNSYDAFNRAYAMAPLDSNIRRWRIAASFGIGGWKLALDTLIAAPPLDPEPEDFNEQRLKAYEIVFNGINDADERARSAGLHYPRLGHISLLYELLTEVVKFGFGNLDTKLLEHERWHLGWQAVEIYRALPLKPVPPKRALEQEMLAQGDIREGKIDGDAFKAAVAATIISPWWPEAHYNLAIFARDSYFGYNLSYDGVTYAENARIAAQEFIFYLSLSPQGTNAEAACRQLQKWRDQCPSN